MGEWTQESEELKLYWHCNVLHKHAFILILIYFTFHWSYTDVELVISIPWRQIKVTILSPPVAKKYIQKG